MTPIDFVVYEGDSMPNQPAYFRVAEAMQKPIKIHSFSSEWEVVGYYFDDGHMVLDIAERTDD